MNAGPEHGRSSRFDVLVPYGMRRAVLANGEGGPLPFARGEVAGRGAEVVGDRARLDLLRNGEGSIALRLQDWTAEACGDGPAVAPETEAWRFTVVGGGDELAAEVDKLKQRRSLLADATRYWRLQGSSGTWFWGNGPAPGKNSRSRTFHLWRDEPGGDPLVVVTITATEERNVESVVSAAGESVAADAATDLDEELAVLLAVGGFQVELVGRNERISSLTKWAAGFIADDVTGPPYR